MSKTHWAEGARATSSKTHWPALLCLLNTLEPDEIEQVADYLEGLRQRARYVAELKPYGARYLALARAEAEAAHVAGQSFPVALEVWRAEAEAWEREAKGYPVTPRFLALLDEIDRLNAKQGTPRWVDASAKPKAPAVPVSESTPGHADTGTRRARSGPLVPPVGANDAPVTPRGCALMCAIRAACGPLEVKGPRQLTAYALMDRGLVVQAQIPGAFWVELTDAGRSWQEPRRKERRP